MLSHWLDKMVPIASITRSVGVQELTWKLSVTQHVDLVDEVLSCPGDIQLDGNYDLILN